jgi:hypothetical protein
MRGCAPRCAGNRSRTQASPEQRAWLSELERAAGNEFDLAYVDRLRAADGNAFALIASVRAGTRNSVVRDFAERASAAVMRHMALLESTGLVDYAALPAPGTAGQASGDRRPGDPATGDPATGDQAQAARAAEQQAARAAEQQAARAADQQAARAAGQRAKAEDVLHRGDRRVAGGPLVQPKSFDIGPASRSLAWLLVLAGLAAVAVAGLRALRAR